MTSVGSGFKTMHIVCIIRYLTKVIFLLLALQTGKPDVLLVRQEPSLSASGQAATIRPLSGLEVVQLLSCCFVGF